jgi:hypothetical protein
MLLPNLVPGIGLTQPRRPEEVFWNAIFSANVVQHVVSVQQRSECPDRCSKAVVLVVAVPRNVNMPD